MTTQSQTKFIPITGLIVILAVIGYYILAAPDRRSTGDKIGDAINELDDRTLGERIGDDLKKD